MRLDDLVQEHYEHMSASDRRVWQYICRHKEECRKMTLHELADACEVSHTTVSRFLQLIGMDGYNDFSAALRKTASISTGPFPPFSRPTARNYFTGWSMPGGFMPMEAALSKNLRQRL